MIAAVVLCALMALSSAKSATKLELGYPTAVPLTADTPCVVDFAASLGAPTVRVTIDVTRSLVDFSGTIQVFAGRYVDGNPQKTLVGSISRESKKDIVLTLDRPNLGGLGSKLWWLVLDSNKDIEVMVTAVSYDFTHRSRVNARWQARSGLIPIEDGASEIFQLDLKESDLPSKVKAVIRAASWGETFTGYTVYANWINKKTLNDHLSSLSIADAIKFISELKNSKVGDTELAKKLAVMFTPSEDNNLFTDTTSFLDVARKDKIIEIDVPGGEGDTTLLVAIQVNKPRLVPFDGKLSAFSVAFLKASETETDVPTTGTCSALSMAKRAVQQDAADPCAALPCGECFDKAGCQYCFSSESGCVADTATCDAGKVTAKDVCTACVTETEADACNAVTDCMFCDGVSSGSLASGCTDKWTCERAQSTTATTTTAVGGTTSAGQPAGTTAAEGGATTADSNAGVPALAAASLIAAVFARLF